MYHKTLKKPSFHAILARIDDELAEAVRSEACPHCDSKLYRADYPRSPLGLPVSCREYYERRRGFCCGTCRKRVAIPSVRFFGRRRFSSAVMILICAFMKSGSRRRYNKIKSYFGISISLRTWARWRRWWRDCFIGSAFWKQAKAQLPIDSFVASFPRQFFLIYPGNLNERLIKVLRFLAPLTAGAYRAV